MFDTSFGDDQSYGAIEAAVKETARGRAFLTEYARRIRQSDTITLLALIEKLERWCGEQAVRLAEFESRMPGIEPDPSAQSAVSDGPGTALQRVEHIASTLRELEARRLELASRFSGPDPGGQRSRPVDSGSWKATLTAPPASVRSGEKELLDDIAKALDMDASRPE